MSKAGKKGVNKKISLYKRGKITAYVIAGLNIIVSAAAFLLNLNIFNLLAQIFFSVVLILGYEWVKYFFALSAVLEGSFALYTIVGEGSGLHISVLLFLIFYIIIKAVFAYILAAGKFGVFIKKDTTTNNSDL